MHARKILCLLLFVLLLLPACSDDEGDGNPVDPGPDEVSPAGMQLIEARDKSFMMGSEQGNADEQPLHSVSFSYDFWMDSTEVRQADYDELMRDNHSDYSRPLWGPPYGIGDDYPAYLVEWGDAALYCNARSARDGLEAVYSYSAIAGTPGNGSRLEGLAIDYSKNGYRLPTEAEWEFACRAGNPEDFFWGASADAYPASAADSAEINAYAVWRGNSWDLSADVAAFGAQPVAQRKPNDFGLYDMCGNLYEWCNDWYGDYSADAQRDPRGATNESYHFVRGGSWGNDAADLRAANRSFTAPDYEFYFIGFRVVLPRQ